MHIDHDMGLQLTVYGVEYLETPEKLLLLKLRLNIKLHKRFLQVTLVKHIISSLVL